jgi:predicted ATPase
MLQALAISNYRSVKDLIVDLGQLNIVSGPNGSGKSSLYKALRLLGDTASGRLVSSLAREGGLPSTMWAGPVRVGKVRGKVLEEPHLRFGFRTEDFNYAVQLGHATQGHSIGSAFAIDPQIKLEAIWAGHAPRPSAMLAERNGPLLRVADAAGKLAIIPRRLSNFDSMLTEFSDPRLAPEMMRLREIIRAWRFYDHFRTDLQSPCRLPQLGTYTPVMADDGADVAAAIQTIIEIGDKEALQETMDDAFPGSRVSVAVKDGWFRVLVSQTGLDRELRASELSDGTIRYLMLAAALLTPRSPVLMVLNEPETSLHPDLVAPLARLIERAAKNTQMIVVSHSEPLKRALVASDKKTRVIELYKEDGETLIAGQGQFDRPPWTWPER